MLLKNYSNLYYFITISFINVVLLFFVFNISAHGETTNISGVVTSVEVLTANYIEEVPETRNICDIRQVPITAQRKSTGPSDKKLLGAIIGGVLGSKVGEGSGSQAATALGALLGSALSSGQEIIASFAVKPTSSILTTRKTINKFGKNTTISVKGRHDPCVGIRAVPVGEAMINCILLDHFLMNKAQCN